MRSYASLAATYCLAFVSLIGIADAQSKIALRGTVVTPSGPIADGIVLIEGSTVKAVGQGLKVPSGVSVVDTEGIIYPGLIDLHDHVTWNVLPRWSAGFKTGARYDWQQLPEYRMALDIPHQKMVAEGHGCAAERYAEAKAIVGGATSQAGLYPKDLTMPGQSAAGSMVPMGCTAGLLRELGVASRLYQKGTSEKLHYEVFPLALDLTYSSALIAGLHDRSINAALFHIAEGAEDNASARREFAMLQSRGLLLPGVSIIHGVALTKDNFAAMAKAGVGLVWSPHSNFELYGSTASVAEAKQAGVKIAIAPDWSPTGSDGMLQELKYAAIWNATQSPEPFTNRELFEMATAHAAQLGGIADQTGSIAVDTRADLLILKPQTEGSGDPYGDLVHSSSGDVALVMVDGVPIYGDPQLMKQMGAGSSSATLSVCGRTKTLNFPSSGWLATTSELASTLSRWGSGLSPLSDCR